MSATGPTTPGEDIAAKVEASSLGTPEAKALRATVSDEHAARIVAMAREMDDAERGGESIQSDIEQAMNAVRDKGMEPPTTTPAPALPVGGDAEGLAVWFHSIWTNGGRCLGHHFATDDEPPQCVWWARQLLASDWLAARDAENWDLMHDALCRRGKVCSAHQPGHWPTLAALVAAIAREAAERALVEAADEAEWKWRSMSFYCGSGESDTTLHPVGRWLRDRAASLGDGSGT